MNEGQNINFFQEEIRYELREKRKVREWLSKTAENEEHKIGIVNFVFTNDDILYQLNKEYLSHFTLTDIITFDLSDRDRELTGDVFISIDRARENAKKYKVALKNEIHRLLLHGLLHLMGYKDKSKDEKTVMRAKEEFYLSLFPYS